MKRTQVQIPDPLYAEIKRLAERRDWSVSAVFRRAAEQFVAESGETAPDSGWRLPEPRDMGTPLVDPEHWRDAVANDLGRM